MLVDVNVRTCRHRSVLWTCVISHYGLKLWWRRARKKYNGRQVRAVSNIFLLCLVHFYMFCTGNSVVMHCGRSGIWVRLPSSLETKPSKSTKNSLHCWLQKPLDCDDCARAYREWVGKGVGGGNRKQRVDSRQEMIREWWRERGRESSQAESVGCRKWVTRSIDVDFWVSLFRFLFVYICLGLNQMRVHQEFQHHRDKLNTSSYNISDLYLFTWLFSGSSVSSLISFQISLLYGLSSLYQKESCETESSCTRNGYDAEQIIRKYITQSKRVSGRGMSTSLSIHLITLSEPYIDVGAILFLREEPCFG